MRTATGILESTHGNCCMAVARWLLRGTHRYAYAQAQRVVYSLFSAVCVVGIHTHTHNLVVMIENHCNLSTSGASVSCPPTSNLNQIAVKLQSNYWARVARLHGETRHREVPSCDVPHGSTTGTSTGRGCVVVQH